LLCAALLCACAVTLAAKPRASQLKIEYTVKVTGGEEQLFHVTTDIDNIRQTSLDLSLPRWMPGYYRTEEYARNVRRLRFTDAQGKPLAHRMVARQTWRVETAGVKRIRVEFAYTADTLGVTTAKAGTDFAFFTGVQLFLLPEGQRQAGGRVRFEVPQGWAIASALRPTAEPTVFAAADYDELADAPTQLGRFDVTRFEAGGKQHTLVTTPAGAYDAEKLKELAGVLKRVAETQGQMFGGLPYDNYTFFYFFTMAGDRIGHAIEHANSFVCFPPDGPNAAPAGEAWRAAHEIFHAWNGKRLRPAEMWPYDYGRENVTPLLWFTEGMTDYYASKTLLRAGLYDREQFVNSMAGAVGMLEANDARSYVSPADASMTSWLRSRTLFPYGISFYDQGNVLGLLLDLSLLRDTKGAAGLDEVMRRLYREHYGRGRGFTTEDLVRVVSAVGGRDYAPFFDRHVWGREAPPFGEALALAGYRMERSVIQKPTIVFDGGVTLQGELRIRRVAQNSSAAQSGLAVDDVIQSVEGEAMPGGFSKLAPKLEGRIGNTVRATILRAGKIVNLDLKVDAREVVQYRMVELEGPSAAQLKLRDSWLSNTPGRGGSALTARHGGGGRRAGSAPPQYSPTPK
jgi:predicted metalloprotease with PDZ domain